MLLVGFDGMLVLFEVCVFVFELELEFDVFELTDEMVVDFVLFLLLLSFCKVELCDDFEFVEVLFLLCLVLLLLFYVFIDYDVLLVLL